MQITAKIKLSVLIILLVPFQINIFGQERVITHDAIIGDLEISRAERFIEKVYVHTDRDVYITGEDLMSMALDYALPEDLKDTPQKLVRDPVISPQGDLKLKYTTSCDMNLVQPLAVRIKSSFIPVSNWY